MKNIEIYTDGACSGNPGVGGYGIVFLYNGHRKEFSKGYKFTTNNRMETMAVIKALKMLKEPCNITLYTDSSYVVNSVNKGWVYNWKFTTNNRMETMAVIKALKMLKEPCNITLYTDSSYVVNSVNKGWVYNWKKNNWINSSKKPTPNVDLWEELLPLLDIHKVEFVWVKGHADNVENNRCDFLAREAMKNNDLLDDINYKK